MAIKPYLQLVRLPNLFTAAADSLAGYLLVVGGLAEPAHWLPLVAASVLIYAGGIVLNDVFDYEVDLRERPSRPLPSGRVSRRVARWIGSIGLMLGPALAATSGSGASFLIALGLAGCVLAYDAKLKRTLMGPWVMGSCRGLNFMLGLAYDPEAFGIAGFLIAASLAVFVAGVTWISRSEVGEGHVSGIAAGVALQAWAVVGLMAVSAGLTGKIGEDLREPGDPRWGLAVLVVVAAVVGRADVRALRDPTAGVVQRAVKSGVFALVWLDVAAVAAIRGPIAALPVAALWVPALWIGKWLYAT